MRTQWDLHHAQRDRWCLRGTDHVGLGGLQRAADGGGASLRHVLAQAVLDVPMELLQRNDHNDVTGSQRSQIGNKVTEVT